MEYSDVLEFHPRRHLDQIFRGGAGRRGTGDGGEDNSHGWDGSGESDQTQGNKEERDNKKDVAISKFSELFSFSFSLIFFIV
ncbi:hypothetical protein COLO4_25616 [Corchorus olitorius]|uniref:Uncharacterized protein n=1 Tax=Corchorus olitorius TaxID=93759 RepID=A0A1R3I126_9ROSI|nr:hypothetical protein COLO4_25616 [Corchorus olitorius]